MNYYTIPVSPIPSQTLDVVLSGQNVTVALQARNGELYADVQLNKSYIVRNRICHHAMPIVNSSYAGFAGELTIVDTQGNDAPNYAGLGTRFVLVYYAE